MQDKPFTVKELADFLSCSTATVRRNAVLWGGKKLPGCRVWLFPVEKVRKLAS